MHFTIKRPMAPPPTTTTYGSTQTDQIWWACEAFLPHPFLLLRSWKISGKDSRMEKFIWNPFHGTSNRRERERERETLRTSKRERLSLILDDEPTSLLTRCWRGCSGNVSSSDAKRRLWEKCQRSSPRIFSLCNHRGRLFLVDARCPWCHQARGEVGKSLPESELT